MSTYLLTNYIGLDAVKEIVANQTGKVIPGYVFISIRYLSYGMLCLVIPGLIIVYSGRVYSLDDKWEYVYSINYLIFQWVVILIPIILICIYMYLYRHEDNERGERRRSRESYLRQKVSGFDRYGEYSEFDRCGNDKSVELKERLMEVRSVVSDI